MQSCPEQVPDRKFKLRIKMHIHQCFLAIIYRQAFQRGLK